MKGLLLTVVMAIGIVAARAQYDIIPMPQRISMDAKEMVLNIEGQPQVTERLRPPMLVVISIQPLLYRLMLKTKLSQLMVMKQNHIR